MKKTFSYSSCIFLSLILAACSSNQTESTGMVEPSVESNITPEPVKQQVSDGRSELENELRDRRIVYFEFDQSELNKHSKQLISQHAEYLSQNPGVKLRLDGHADERGTREYNLALGERRARAVRDYLLLSGVPAENLEILSYGEERPLVSGSDTEVEFSQNRRVEFNYLAGELANVPLHYEKTSGLASEEISASSDIGS